MKVLQQSINQTLSLHQLWDTRWIKNPLLGAAPTAFQQLPEGIVYEQEYARNCFNFISPWIDIVRATKGASLNRDEPYIIADVPCGCGTVSLQPDLLEQLSRNNWSLLAADIAPVALQLHKEKMTTSISPIPTQYIETDILSMLRTWLEDKRPPDILIMSRILIHLTYEEIQEIFNLLKMLSKINPWMVTIVFNPYADHQVKRSLKRIEHGLRKNKNTWYIYKKAIDIVPPLECLRETQVQYFNSTEVFAFQAITVPFVHQMAR